jgi:hypothetical protein
MFNCKLPTLLRWAASYCISQIDTFIIRILLWFIRQFGLKFQCKEDGLTYKWVASLDGGFDHWFDFGAEQLAIWTVMRNVGFWRLIVRLLTESEFLVGSRRWAHEEQLLIESENYYCSEPIFIARKPTPHGVRMPDQQPRQRGVEP